MPPAVRNAFVATARVPLLRAEPLYQDVASYSGISWELLAACDWMQCEARARYSPVHGEKLGTVNRDGTSYHTKSEALEQCAEDLVEFAETVYGIDLTAPGPLSVRDLANAFAAFRWGGLLRLHRTSAMEFPYSVAGLTAAAHAGCAGRRSPIRTRRIGREADSASRSAPCPSCCPSTIRPRSRRAAASRQRRWAS